MKKMLFAAMAVWMGYAAFAADILLPETMSMMPDGKSVAIGERRAGRVTVRDFDGKVLRTVSVTKTSGGFLGVGGTQTELPVTGVTVAPDGTLFYTSEDGNDGRLYRENGPSVISGNRPMSPVVSPDGKYVYVCNRFDANVKKFDAKTLQCLATAKAVREAHGIALGKDGKLLFVINLLPDDVTEPIGRVSAKVTVIDAATFKVLDNIPLPDGSSGVRDVEASPDGRFIYMTHVQARYQLPTTQLERGWMNTAALSVFDGVTGKYVNTVLLDDVDLGGANPWGISCSPDGKQLAVTHAGTREVSVIDRKALHDRLDRAARGEKVTEVSTSAAEVHNDLSFLSGIRRRFQFNVTGPRGIVTTNDTVYTVAYYADAMVKIPFTQRIVRPQVIPLNGKILDTKVDPVLRGEMFFNDGTMCFQQWQSCATCHPDGRVDAFNWDLLNDGLGNPKQSKSLYLCNITPPTMVTGIRKDMDHCNRAGFRYIQFTDFEEEDAKCIDAYVIGMKPQVSPWARPENKEAIERGKKVYNKAQCQICHIPEYAFTAAIDPKDGSKSALYDIGLGTRDEEGQLFDVPTLNEVWRTAPYLYDGRAKNMREVLTKYNIKDQHGVTSNLTEQELSDLEIYILSL